MVVRFVEQQEIGASDQQFSQANQFLLSAAQCRDRKAKFGIGEPQANERRPNLPFIAGTSHASVLFEEAGVFLDFARQPAFVAVDQWIAKVRFGPGDRLPQSGHLRRSGERFIDYGASGIEARFLVQASDGQLAARVGKAAFALQLTTDQAQ